MRPRLPCSPIKAAASRKSKASAYRQFDERYDLGPGRDKVPLRCHSSAGSASIVLPRRRIEGGHDGNSNDALQTLRRCVKPLCVAPPAGVHPAMQARPPGRVAMTSMKQLVKAPAQEGGPRHRCDRAEAKNGHRNNFADHSLTNSRVTKARQANVV